MKFLVSATQLITQDVQFVVDVPDDCELPLPEVAGDAITNLLTDKESPKVVLYDAHDEVYLKNIVTGVRPATEEESK